MNDTMHIDRTRNSWKWPLFVAIYSTTYKKCDSIDICNSNSTILEKFPKRVDCVCLIVNNVLMFLCLQHLINGFYAPKISSTYEFSTHTHTHEFSSAHYFFNNWFCFSFVFFCISNCTTHPQTSNFSKCFYRFVS